MAPADPRGVGSWTTVGETSSTSGWDVAGRLAPAASAGDQRAIGGLIRATHREVWRFVASLAGPGDADDLTQETFVRAIRSLPSFQGRSSVRTWLLVIARRVVVDHHRYRSARPLRADLVDWQQTAERAMRNRTAQAAGFEDVAELSMLLADLTDDRREALLLTQVLGLSYAEAALICRCPVGTIRSRVARARADLNANGELFRCPDRLTPAEPGRWSPLGRNATGRADCLKENS